jgi:hypothetical protein
VPAKAEGSWRIDLTGASPARYDVELKQKYQMLEGQARAGNNASPVREGRLRGEEVSFNIGGRTFTGKVSGDRMEGTSRGGSEARWTGTRMK